MLEELRVLHGVLGIEPDSAACKASTLPAVLSLRPQVCLFFHLSYQERLLSKPPYLSALCLSMPSHYLVSPVQVSLTGLFFSHPLQ